MQKEKGKRKDKTTMQFIVNTEEFKKALTNVRKIVTNRSTLPSLYNVRMTLKKNVLTLATTNLATAILFSLPVQSEENGEFLIEANTLLEKVKLIKDEELFISTQGKSLFLKRKKSVSQFPIIPDISDFPLLDFKGNCLSSITMKSNTLKESLEMTLYAAAKDESRPVFTGVLFSQEWGNNTRTLEIIAADSFRLARCTYKNLVLSNTLQKYQHIIPAQELKTILSILPEDEAVVLEFFENMVCMTSDQMKIYIRTIEGNYPDVHELFERLSEIGTVVLPTKELLDGYKQLKSIAKDSSNITHFQLNDQEVRLFARNIDTQRSEVIIIYTIKQKCEPIMTCFNVEYMIEALTIFQNKKIHTVSCTFVKNNNSTGGFCVILRGYNAYHSYESLIMAMSSKNSENDYDKIIHNLLECQVEQEEVAA